MFLPEMMEPEFNKVAVGEFSVRSPLAKMVDDVSSELELMRSSALCAKDDEEERMLPPLNSSRVFKLK